MIIPLGDPASGILGLEEAKEHLRITHADEDGLIAGLITAAEAHIESFTGRTLVERAFQLVLDRWPDGPVRLPRPPLIAVDRVAVLGLDDVPHLIEAERYRVETRAEPGFLLPAGLGSLPAPGRPVSGIEIDFRAGFGRDWNAVPPPVREAAKALVADLYATRGLAGIVTSRRLLDLLIPFRIMGLT